MSDPTRIHAVNQQDAPQWAVLVRIQSPGFADAMLTLPASCNTEEKVASFLATVMAKLKVGGEIGQSNVDPFTDDEQTFLASIAQCATKLVENIEWRVLRSFTPAEVSNILAELAPERRKANWEHN